MNDDLERFFSIAEASRILGFERSTLYSRIKTGRLQAVKLDGAPKIPRSEIKRYLSTATPLTVRS
jgi:excisionase family DNA binding protein